MPFPGSRGRTLGSDSAAQRINRWRPLSQSEANFCRRLLGGLLLASLALAPGQERAPVPAPIAESRTSDANLEKAIQEKLVRSKIGVNGFTVRVRNGIATLGGHTDTIQHKGVATRLAKSAGARQVDNRIEITEQARRKAQSQRRGQPRRVHVRRGEAR